MITVKLMGGLGNQMFQAAYGMALEAKGYEVAYDKTALEYGKREYELRPFGPRRFHHYGKEPVQYPPFHFDERYLSPIDPSIQVGYWQSEKYFAGVKDRVRKVFNSGLYAPYVSVEQIHSIALHVRRGDYVDLQHFHGMPDIDYYREAVAYIRRQVGYLCPVTVISDDHSWCRENLPREFTIFEGRNKYEDMGMIASCSYQVIANSSFSWWGAYLGPQRLVVAPKKWFAETSMNASDVIPERWVKL